MPNSITRTNLMLNGFGDAESLFSAVIKWGKEKGIDNPIMQYAKLNEEVGEIAHELTRSNLDSAEMKDALGDTLVTLIILANILDYDLIDCLLEAYCAIKDRKGSTVNGSFVKDN